LKEFIPIPEDTVAALISNARLTAYPSIRKSLQTEATIEKFKCPVWLQFIQCG
jgi:hypothetical protein